MKKDDQKQGDQRIRPCRAGKISERKRGSSEQIQVLRIADRRGHAAKIGRDRLHDHRAHHKIFPLDHAADEDGERDERDQCHIVGDDHAAEETKQDQRQGQPLCSFRAPHQ